MKKPVSKSWPVWRLGDGELDLLFTMADEAPARLVKRPVLDERFAVVARRGHAEIGSKGLDLETYLRLPHLLISFSGDVRGRDGWDAALTWFRQQVAETVGGL